MGPSMTDETGMEWNIGEHPFRARRILRSAKVSAVPSDNYPFLVEQDLLQIPILPTRFANPHDVRRFLVAAFAGHQCKFGAEALVDEELGH